MAEAKLKKLTLAVVDLGYIGLALAVEFGQANHHVDVDRKVLQ